jgi:two-component system, NtrC family, sensor kinase
MRRSALANLLILAITVAIVVGAFASFQRKRSSFERIDFRFSRHNGIIVVQSVDPNSNAAKADLRPGDQIWTIAGTPTTEIDQLQKSLRRIGDQVPMLVNRAGQTFTLTYEVPELKVDYSYLILCFIGFLYLAIGLFTLFRGGRRESMIFYFVTLLSFIVYVYTPAGDVDTLYKALQLIEEFATIILPALTLNFFLVFPRPIVRHRGLLAALWIPPALLAVWNIDLLVFANRFPLATARRSFEMIRWWELTHFAIYFTLAVVALAYTYRTAAAVGRKQIKWIYLGMAAGFLPFLAVYLVPYLVIGSVKPIYTTISILPLALIPLAFAVSILKYRLWDVEVIIKEILAYSITFIFGMIAFSTINLLLSSAIEESAVFERNFLAFASGLLIAGVLIPVKGRVESVIERFVYRDSYKHRRAMSEFAQELATFHDVHELISMMRERLRAAVGLQRMNLFTREGPTLVIYEPEAGVPRRAAIVDFGSMPAEGPLLLSEPRLPEASDVPWQLLRGGYRYVFPLRNRGELQGVLILGTKRGEEPLSRDDLHLVESLTAPIALALENSRLYGRLRRQLAEIQALKEYNENIIESSSSAIAVVSAEGFILTANTAFWDLVGGPELEGPIGVLFPPYEELRRSGDRSLATSFVNREGVEKEVTLTTNPLNADDVVNGAHVVVIGDVTERVRLERELQDKERLASLGLLAAGVAHEVNTPLTGISSYAQLLLADTPQDDPKYRLLKKMEQQSFRASNLVNNLLDLIANRPRTREMVSIPALISATLSLHEDLLKAKSIRVNVAPVPDLQVKGNFQDLQQVVTNILLNARDAVGTGGNIWIAAEEKDDCVEIRIKDDGKGIAADIIGRIFEPLVTTKRGQGGTGLGLAITRRILTANEGEIAVESTPGRGAEFTITLPNGTPPSPAAGPAASRRRERDALGPAGEDAGAPHE